MRSLFYHLLQCLIGDDPNAEGFCVFQFRSRFLSRHQATGACRDSRGDTAAVVFDQLFDLLPRPWQGAGNNEGETFQRAGSLGLSLFFLVVRIGYRKVVLFKHDIKQLQVFLIIEEGHNRGGDFLPNLFNVQDVFRRYVIKLFEALELSCQ